MLCSCWIVVWQGGCEERGFCEGGEDEKAEAAVRRRLVIEWPSSDVGCRINFILDLSSASCYVSIIPGNISISIMLDAFHTILDAIFIILQIIHIISFFTILTSILRTRITIIIHHISLPFRESQNKFPSQPKHKSQSYIYPVFFRFR
jgi:hypothetical protein